jgi:hypothetical protein
VESFNLLNHTNLIALNQFYGAESSSLSTFLIGNKAGIPRQLEFSLDFELYEDSAELRSRHPEQFCDDHLV